ncbi:Na+/H+ antiporter NhaC family protein (plasmid) [Paraclostridium benzoelyticum]
MSIGNSMGIPAGLTAGGIISGAFFGDKMSPLSDSTNLAAAICKTDVITHIKHMMFTTVPAYLICIVLYTVIGLKYANNVIDYNQINQIKEVLSSTFNIGLVSLIPIIFLLVLLLLQKPPIVSILASALLGGIIAVIQEGQKIGDLLNYVLNGYSIETGISYADKLLNRGGIMSMAETVLLVFIVFIVAGILQKQDF